MNKKVLEELKGMTTEERLSYFKAHKGEILDELLKSVNGGNDAGVKNPDSEDVFENAIFSSFDFICKGEEVCA